jgi:hypothetical protein
MIAGSFGHIAPVSARDHETVLVGLGVDGGGQVAQGGRGVTQRGLVAVRKLGQRCPDDVLVHLVPAGNRLRASLGQIQADGAAVAVAVGAWGARHVPRRLQPAEQGGYRARREPEHPGELARPDPWVLGDAGEQLELGHGKPEGGVGGPRRPAHGAAQPGHDVGKLRADLLAPGLIWAYGIWAYVIWEGLLLR